MRSKFEEDQKLDNELLKYDEDALNKLYLKVFDTDYGKLVLRDLENRCFVSVPAPDDISEGMRLVFLSIVTRMRDAIIRQPKG